MARRSYKKTYRKARSYGGKYKPILDGLLAGAVNKFVGGYIPIPGVGNLAVGYFRKNQTLMTLGGMQLLDALGNFGSTGSGNGYIG